jgi:hypothetical protein
LGCFVGELLQTVDVGHRQFVCEGVFLSVEHNSIIDSTICRWYYRLYYCETISFALGGILFGMWETIAYIAPTLESIVASIFYVVTGAVAYMGVTTWKKKEGRKMVVDMALVLDELSALVENAHKREVVIFDESGECVARSKLGWYVFAEENYLYPTDLFCEIKEKWNIAMRRKKIIDMYFYHKKLPNVVLFLEQIKIILNTFDEIKNNIKLQEDVRSCDPAEVVSDWCKEYDVHIKKEVKKLSRILIGKETRQILLERKEYQDVVSEENDIPMFMICNQNAQKELKRLL